MDITILVKKNGMKFQVTGIKSHATRIPGVHRTRWYGPATETGSGREYCSLTHVMTGRSLNMVPLTVEESERLIDALMECDVEWERIVDGSTAKRYYVDRLTGEGEILISDESACSGISRDSRFFKKAAHVVPRDERETVP